MSFMFIRKALFLYSWKYLRSKKSNQIWKNLKQLLRVRKFTTQFQILLVTKSKTENLMRVIKLILHLPFRYHSRWAANPAGRKRKWETAGWNRVSSCLSWHFLTNLPSSNQQPEIYPKLHFKEQRRKQSYLNGREAVTLNSFLSTLFFFFK